MPAASYVLIVRPDPQADGRYVAVCPDIPGWYATGSSPAEASKIGAEIIRGIVSERRANGAGIPAVHTQSVEVSVAPPRGPKPIPSLSESEGFQALASVVAESRESLRTERGESPHASATGMSATGMPPGRVLKSNHLGPQ